MGLGRELCGQLETHFQKMERARWFGERGEGWGVLGGWQRMRGHGEPLLGQRPQEARNWWGFRALGSLNSQPTDKRLVS